MAYENNLSFIKLLWGMVEDYYLDRKAKYTLHKKQFAPVLSEIRAHYACHHRDDLEWFLNDLKTQEPELSSCQEEISGTSSEVLKSSPQISTNE